MEVMAGEGEEGMLAVEEEDGVGVGQKVFGRSSASGAFG
jgi:hypothetical protein